MASFGVTARMDTDNLAFVYNLRSKPGLHIDYQYGYQSGVADHDFPFPTPIYDGLSLRMFLYNKHPSIAKVRLAYAPRPGSYFASLQLLQNKIEATYGTGSANTETNHPARVDYNKFVSLGVRVMGNHFHLLIDRWVGPGYDQKGKIKDYKWNAKIFTGLNYAVSLHLCDEVGRDFPNDGLGKEYDFAGLVLPVGSSATVTLIFTGASDENVWLGFHQDGSKFVGHQYDRVGLNRREEFTVLVRNAKGRWLLATSFVQSGFISVPRQNQHEKLNLVSSDNCTIKRILAVCGPVPYRYRPK